MIEEIRISNFQCHERKDLILEKITVFTGDNGTGKSALLRALYWLLFNWWEGSADQFITWGKNRATVSASIDGRWLTREKGEGENTYTLDSETFRAWHPNIPEQIRSFLRVSEDSIQQQDDPSFWLMLTSGQAAHALNDIFNLTQIDDSLSSVASELRTAKSRAIDTKARYKKVKAERNELKWVLKADKDLKRIEELAIQIKENDDKIEDMERQLKQLETAEGEKDRVSKLLGLAEKTLSAGEKLLRVEAKIKRLEELNRLEERRCQLQKTLNQRTKELEKMLEGICPLCQRGPP